MKNAFKKVTVVIVAFMLFLLCSCSDVSETQVSTTAASTRSSNFKAPDFPDNMDHEPPQGMGFDISNKELSEDEIKELSKTKSLGVNEGSDSIREGQWIYVLCSINKETASAPVDATFHLSSFRDYA